MDVSWGILGLSLQRAPSRTGEAYVGTDGGFCSTLLGTLAEQLEPKWAQARGSRVLCEDSALVDQLKVNRVWAVRSWGAICWECPGKWSGAEVVEA